METEETEDKYADLKIKYPKLFQYEDEARVPYALFGIECGPGWYNIIDKCCETLYSKVLLARRDIKYYENYLDDLPNYLAMRNRMATYSLETEGKTPSDSELVADLQNQYDKALLKLSEEESKLPVVLQVKEKFGTLRIYIHNASEAANMVVDYAESLSEVTCEMCGAPGKIYRVGWHSTLCREHAVKKYDPETLKEYESEESNCT